MTELPSAFIKQMQNLLKEEFPKFLETYNLPPTRSLRVNTLKITPDSLKERVPFHLEPVPWCPDAFYYQHIQDRPGKHVYHAAGLYYIQDASAMAPVEALEPKPGETVLDLCAAPGGKTTQIAAKMKGKGLLVANEIDRKRISALIENLERCGVTNAVVLNESPEKLRSRFTHFFDRILVDAPCSGEGMFRKDPEVMERWSTRLIEKCKELQLNILEAASEMLKPGGRLVYSTCTFNPKENEEVIARFLSLHHDFDISLVPHYQYYKPGRPEWTENTLPDIQKTARLWPHHLRGEGHFIAVLQKSENAPENKPRIGQLPKVPSDALKKWKQFINETFYDTEPFISDSNKYTLFGEHLYQVPDELPSLRGLKVERPGRYLGQIKKKHVLPSHALALSLNSSQIKNVQAFSLDSPELIHYLQGETLSSATNQKGWTLVTVDGFSLGWGKSSGGYLKNHYPKWLRWDKTD